MTCILIKALLWSRFLPICLLNIPKYIFWPVLADRVAKSVNMGNGKLEKVQWNVCKPTPEFS